MTNNPKEEIPMQKKKKDDWLTVPIRIRYGCFSQRLFACKHGYSFMRTKDPKKAKKEKEAKSASLVDDDNGMGKEKN